MLTALPVPRTNDTTLACHLGIHDWMKIRDDEWRVHFRCRHCDHTKADNSAWWEFTSAGR